MNECDFCLQTPSARIMLAASKQLRS